MRALGFLLLIAVVASADTLDNLRGQAVRLVIADLEDLAEWCSRNKLAGERDIICEWIVRLDPEHVRARKQLKYQRDREGAWVRKRSYRAPKNRGKKAWPEYEAKRKEVRERFAANIRSAFEAQAESASDTSRARALSSLLAVDPDNDWARERSGEVWIGEKWRLKETATALFERRKALADAARTALAEAKDPKQVEPRAYERDADLEWGGFFEGLYWRGAGTAPSDEIRLAVRLSDAAHPLFAAAFGFDPPPSTGYGFYLAGSEADGHAILRAWPGIESRKLESMLRRRSTSKWIPGASTYVKWSKTKTVRIDSATRQAIGVLLANEFGISPKQGWAWEGVGIQLAYRLTGLRLSTFLRVTGYAEKITEKNEQIQERIYRKGADWLGLAGEVLATWTHQDLVFALSKDTNQLTAEDLLVGHALAAYLIEGFPPEASRKTMKALGSGETLDDALRAGTGRGLEATAKRLRRWLAETS